MDPTTHRFNAATQPGPHERFPHRTRYVGPTRFAGVKFKDGVGWPFNRFHPPKKVDFVASQVSGRIGVVSIQSMK